MSLHFARYLFVPVLALLLSLSAVFSIMAQEATPETDVVHDEDTRAFPVSILSGTCEEPGDTTHDLALVGLPEGGEVVNEPAIPAYEGATIIPDATLDDFLTEDHVVTVAQSTEDETIVACGLIGGTRYANNLLFSLPPEGDPTFSAIVKMAEGDDGVTVSVFLTISLVTDLPVAETPEGATPIAEPTEDEEEVAETEELARDVQMYDIGFGPEAIVIPGDTDIRFNINNEGVAFHTFTIDELDIDSGEVDAGQRMELTINAPAGEYTYYCRVPGHLEAGMMGTLIVE